MFRNTRTLYAAVAAACSLGLIGTVGGTAYAGTPSTVRASPPIYLDTSYSFPERAADLVSFIPARIAEDDEASQPWPAPSFFRPPHFSSCRTGRERLGFVRDLF